MEHVLLESVNICPIVSNLALRNALGELKRFAFPTNVDSTDFSSLTI